MYKIFLLNLLLLSLTNVINGAEEPTNPKQRTNWSLYLNSKETFEYIKRNRSTTLFIDVRDQIEIMFTGFTADVYINSPFKMADKTTWNDGKRVFQMELNPKFESEIEIALKNKGLSKIDAIIIMCRSGGTRGAPCANTLWGKGYKQIYVVTDGFEGGKTKDGDRKGQRVVNGWRNSGLPWSYKLNKSKIYINN